MDETAKIPRSSTKSAKNVDGAERQGVEKTESPHPQTKSAWREARQLECGVVNNYRTIFEDLEAVYLLGIQIDIIS